ncbi:MAG: hypothetical protein U0T82_15615 [Bacteroidales bacterium]
MRTFMLFLTGVFLGWQPTSAQTKATIENVDFQLENNMITVNYDIKGSSHLEVFRIDLKFVTNTNEVIVPVNIKGDVGAPVLGGNNKKIYWDVVADQIEISGTLRAIVTIMNSEFFYGGPSNALLSTLVPGLGGYFVGKNKIRPVITTVSAAGLISYGIYQKRLSNSYYRDYKTGTDPSDISSDYEKANKAQHNYYISTRVGAAIWITDIAWVAYKGFQNKKKAQNSTLFVNNASLGVGFLNNGVIFKYALSF